MFGDFDHFMREEFHLIGLAPAAIAHARKIDGGDMIIGCQIGGDKGPPPGMGRIAMDK